MVFIVMKSLKIYSLSNFPICNSVLLTLVTRLCITSPGPTYFIVGSRRVQTPLSSEPLPPLIRTVNLPDRTSLCPLLALSFAPGIPSPCPSKA